MRNQTQEPPTDLYHPVPASALAEAAGLWWAAFGPPLARGKSPRMRPENAIVALDGAGGVKGVIGLRNAQGGFPARAPLAARIAFRAAPSTADLVVDGIVVRHTRRGVGRDLLSAAAALAGRQGHPGLRAEVHAANRPALAFYEALGFYETGRGRFGWPWSGPVILLRRAVTTD